MTIHFVPLLSTNSLGRFLAVLSDNSCIQYIQCELTSPGHYLYDTIQISHSYCKYTLVHISFKHSSLSRYSVHGFLSIHIFVSSCLFFCMLNDCVALHFLSTYFSHLLKLLHFCKSLLVIPIRLPFMSRFSSSNQIVKFL